jgi:hypothetical protein
MKGLPRSLSRGPASAAPVLKQTFVVRDGEVTVTATGAAVGFGTTVIGDLPEGNILLLGAVGYFQFGTADADIAATWDGDYSVGSTATVDVTLNGTDVDILPSTALGAATAQLSPRVRSVNATQAILDNTDGSLELNLNLLVDAANIVDGATAVMTINGELTLLYSVMGDD